MVAVAVSSTARVARSDTRSDKRNELLVNEMLRMMKRAEGQPPLTGRDFANTWRKTIAKVADSTCACSERYPLDRKMRAHCSLDAMTEMMLELMPVLLRIPGVLQGMRKAFAGTKDDASKYAEATVTSLMEEWVPAKERLRMMQRLYECIGNLGRTP